MEFRKVRGSDTWHWCQNCSNYPTENFTRRDGRPSSGELCDECKGKEAAGKCEPKR